MVGGTRFGAVVVALVMGVVLTACGDAGGGGEDGVGGGQAGASTATEGTLEITGTNGLAFEPQRLTAPAGEVTVQLTSEPQAPHTFTIEELGDVDVVRADGGQTATGSVTLDPGTYTFYCAIPGHRQAGMEGKLTVE